jgi:hypothetical protein
MGSWETNCPRPGNCEVSANLREALDWQMLNLTDTKRLAHTDVSAVENFSWPSLGLGATFKRAELKC